MNGWFLHVKVLRIMREEDCQATESEKTKLFCGNEMVR